MFILQEAEFWKDWKVDGCQSNLHVRPQFVDTLFIVRRAHTLIQRSFQRVQTNNWLKISYTTIIPIFFIVKGFFLKTKFISAFMIFVSSAVSTVTFFAGVFTELVYDTLAPWKKKEKRTCCNLFLFCFLRFKCYCFCL